MITHATDLPRERLELMLKLSPPHLKPIALAVRDMGAMFIMVAQGKQRVRVPEGKRPVIALIGDDLHEAKGPGGFDERSLRHLLEHAAHVSIVSCEPLLVAYATAVAVAIGAAGIGLEQRLGLIIETRPERERDWAKLVERTRPDVPLLIATTRPEGVSA
jgi:hypothetical protein